MTDKEDKKRSSLPSERAEQQKKDKAAAEELQDLQLSMLREDFTRTFQTDHGKRVLAWIAQRCGHNVPPLAANQKGEIDEKITTHNAMELSFYLAIRKYISVDLLKMIEFGEVNPSGHLDPEDIKQRITSKDQSEQKG